MFPRGYFPVSMYPPNYWPKTGAPKPGGGKAYGGKRFSNALIGLMMRQQMEEEAKKRLGIATQVGARHSLQDVLAAETAEFIQRREMVAAAFNLLIVEL